MKRILSIISICIIISMLAVGCSGKPDSGQNGSEGPKVEDGDIADNGSSGEDKSAELWKTTLYFPDKDAMYVEKEERDINIPAQADISQKASSIIEELVKGSGREGIITSIPKGTKVLSASLDGSTITLDLSKEFESNHPGGSTGIQMTMAQTILSITEIEGVDAVSFKIDGKVLGDFKGHIEFNRPFKRSEYQQFIAKD